MRHFFSAAALIAVLGVLPAPAQDGKKTVIAGPHICCGSCEKSVAAILGKVEGVADVTCDRKNKTVAFTAKNIDAARAALTAMYEGGFAGSATYGDKKLGVTSAVAGTTKADTITVKGVHACCGQCTNAIKKLFPDAKVTFTGKGPQRDVTIAGKDLTGSDVVGKLTGAGFNGKVEK